MLKWHIEGQSVTYVGAALIEDARHPRNEMCAFATRLGCRGGWRGRVVTQEAARWRDFRPSSTRDSVTGRTACLDPVTKCPSKVLIRQERELR
jgi:hypothetical protein